MSKLNNLINKLCPDGVEFKTLGDVCKLVTGATPSKSNPDYWENGTISWMSSGEVNLKRIFSTETKITQAG
ncbi:MAG: restriction endonuclease subunit S, partial [Ruminococcus sp.]|nr:restriction endonuclease subunit S [Ruminococcus sp.]